MRLSDAQHEASKSYRSLGAVDEGKRLSAERRDKERIYSRCSELGASREVWEKMANDYKLAVKYGEIDRGFLHSYHDEELDGYISSWMEWELEKKRHDARTKAAERRREAQKMEAYAIKSELHSFWAWLQDRENSTGYFKRGDVARHCGVSVKEADRIVKLLYEWQYIDRVPGNWYTMQTSRSQGMKRTAFQRRDFKKVGPFSEKGDTRQPYNVFASSSKSAKAMSQIREFEKARKLYRESQQLRKTEQQNSQLLQAAQAGMVSKSTVMKEFGLDYGEVVKHIKEVKKNA